MGFATLDQVKKPKPPAVTSARQGRIPITLKGEIDALLASGKVGSHALILDDKDVILLLKAAVEKEGSVSAFAKRHGLERTNLSNMLSGKRPVSSSLVKVWGCATCIHLMSERRFPPPFTRELSYYPMV